MAKPLELRRALPHAKLVAMLRCPVARAASHYAMLARFQV